MHRYIYYKKIRMIHINNNQAITNTERRRYNHFSFGGDQVSSLGSRIDRNDKRNSNSVQVL